MFQRKSLLRNEEALGGYSKDRANVPKQIKPQNILVNQGQSCKLVISQRLSKEMGKTVYRAYRERNSITDYITLVKDCASILQSLVIIGVTIFTARWTYKTFAHKEKIQELKELKRAVDEYHLAIQIFCGPVRETEEPDEQEMREKLHLGALHNKLVSLSRLNLYTKKKCRDRIQSIVASWIINQRIEGMQRRPNWERSEEDRAALWQEFEQQYEEVKELIDAEAGRLL